MSGTPELIDLSNISDEIEDPSESASFQDSRRLPPPVPSLPVESSTGSSDVEFVSSRPIPQATNLELSIPPRPGAASSYPFQPFVHGYNHLRDMLERGTAFMAGTRYGQGAAGASRGNHASRVFEEEVQRVTQAAMGNHHRVRLHQRRDPDTRILPAPIMAEEFDAIAFDYTRPAFAVGGIIDGEGGSSTPDRRPTPPYKPPPAAPEGFTRKIEEDDVVVCVNCGDELGAGDGEVKQQVWVAKNCGHVWDASTNSDSHMLTVASQGYCGECATNRHIGRGANKKDKHASAQRKTLPFKTCRADQCEKPVMNKTSMIQVYL